MEAELYRLSLSVGVGSLAIVSALVGINIALYRIAVALENKPK